jgi:N-acetylglucosaminyldiphosphoundecaprenol N-acetyl-beta-D-mannosaminyltransferase
MRTIHVLGVPLSPQRYDAAVADLIEAAAGGRRLRAHFCTVHSVVEATGDVRLREVFATADLACTDGVPLVWACRRRGALEAERVAGPDVMLSVCDAGRRVGLRHYFLGGRPGTPEALAEALTTRFPGLEVAGTHSPPFRPLSDAEDAEMVEAINASGANVLWIGLGSPKQDFWAASHALRLQVPVVLAVGAAFDFHSGRLRRAPRWMRRAGLEWLFRLAMEPRRLWRRYLSTNVRFAYLLFRETLRVRSSRRPLR